MPSHVRFVQSVREILDAATPEEEKEQPVQ